MIFNKLKKYKWRFYWFIFGLMACLIVLLAIFFEDKAWLGNALQTLCTISGIYATILMYLHSQEGSEFQFRQQLEHLQRLNTVEIEALKESTEKQIGILQKLTDKQIRALRNLTEKQIQAIHKATEGQIDALQKNTIDQIKSFEKQTTEIASKLSDNSILLAEILGRELEKAIELYTHAYNQEEAKYKDLSGWKLLRTDIERKNQLDNQGKRIEAIRRGYEYLMEKYNNLRKFLGYGTKSIEQ